MCRSILIFLLLAGTVVSQSRVNIKDVILGSNTVTAMHWVLIHYHKTGHELSFKLMSKLKTKCKLEERMAPKRIAIFSQEGKSGKSINPESSTFENAFPLEMLLKRDIIHSVPGPMVFNWTSAFSFSSSHTYRIIHFIRDPFETIMSGFLYHSQTPSPPSESWLHLPDMTFCPRDKDVVFQAAAILEKYHSNSSVVRQWLELAMDDCLQLLGHIRSTHKDSSYLAMLRRAKSHHLESGTKGNLSEIPLGIRIEAYRTLFGSAKFMGGDLLSMAINVLQQPPQLVRSFYLEDFVFGNIEMFRNTVFNLFEFLYEPIPNFKPSSPKKSNRISFSNLIQSKQGNKFSTSSKNSTTPATCRLCQCVPLNEAVDAAVREAFVRNTSAITGHITKGIQSKDERQLHKRLLAEDKILGPILTFLADLIHRHHELNKNFHLKVSKNYVAH